MPYRKYPTLTERLLDKIVTRLEARIAGPAVLFTSSPGSNPGHVSAACIGPQVGDTEVGFLQAQDPDVTPPASVPPAVPVPSPPGIGAAAADPWPAGHGRRANDCLFLDDPRHECLNSYGFPIRSGQACWHSARVETLRSFTEQHPAFGRLINPDGQVA